MDSTHVHLLLNHFPIVGTLVATAILVYGVIRRNSSNQQVALAALAVMALLAIPVMLTGEPAEERVENIAGVTEAAIEAHEEAAELAFWVMEATGILALIGLLLSGLKNRLAQPAVILTLILSIASFGLMARTGSLGGKIRHTELAGAIAAGTTGETGVGAETGAEKEDDD